MTQNATNNCPYILIDKPNCLKIYCSIVQEVDSYLEVEIYESNCLKVNNYIYFKKLNRIHEFDGIIITFLGEYINKKIFNIIFDIDSQVPLIKIVSLSNIIVDLHIANGSLEVLLVDNSLLDALHIELSEGFINNLIIKETTVNELKINDSIYDNLIRLNRLTLEKIRIKQEFILQASVYEVQILPGTVVNKFLIKEKEDSFDKQSISYIGKVSVHGAIIHDILLLSGFIIKDLEISGDESSYPLSNTTIDSLLMNIMLRDCNKKIKGKMDVVEGVIHTMISNVRINNIKIFFRRLPEEIHVVNLKSYSLIEENMDPTLFIEMENIYLGYKILFKDLSNKTSDKRPPYYIKIWDVDPRYDSVPLIILQGVDVSGISLRNLNSKIKLVNCYWENCKFKYIIKKDVGIFQKYIYNALFEEAIFLPDMVAAYMKVFNKEVNEIYGVKSPVLYTVKKVYGEYNMESFPSIDHVKNIYSAIQSNLEKSFSKFNISGNLFIAERRFERYITNSYSYKLFSLIYDTTSSFGESLLRPLHIMFVTIFVITLFSILMSPYDLNNLSSSAFQLISDRSTISIKLYFIATSINATLKLFNDILFYFINILNKYYPILYKYFTIFLYKFLDILEISLQIRPVCDNSSFEITQGLAKIFGIMLLGLEFIAIKRKFERRFYR